MINIRGSETSFIICGVLLPTIICLGAIPMIVVGSLCLGGASWCTLSHGGAIAVTVVGAVLLVVFGCMMIALCGCYGKDRQCEYMLCCSQCFV